jgi:lysophospholipase L1-like esterase
MKKLVLFGDSLFGQLGKHRIVNMETALPGYDVYNCAAGGWDTNDCVKKAPYIAKLEPDVIVISLGTNDAAPWKQVPLDAFITNIPKIFAAFPSSKLIYFLPPPVNENKTPEEKKGLNNEVLKQYHDVAKQVCKEHGIAVLSSWEAFKPLLDNGNDYHVEDGVHLNDDAYDTINTQLAKLIH